MERFGVKFEASRDGLVFPSEGKDMKSIRPRPRIPDEMRNVVLDPDALDDWDGPLYLMYRGIQRMSAPSLRREFSRHRIRYDITFIRPGFIGDEYVKTHGHFHPRIPGTRRYYGETYEILSGRAIFLLQHRKLEDFLVVEARKGQGVFIPGEYGHVTVNPGRRPLVLGNLVAGFDSDYTSVERKHGFAYYVLKGQIFVANPHYRKYPPLRWIGAKRMHPLDKAFHEDKDWILSFLGVSQVR